MGCVTSSNTTGTGSVEVEEPVQLEEDNNPIVTSDSVEAEPVKSAATFAEDEAVEAAEVGAMKVRRGSSCEDLRRVIKEGRREIKLAQEKLSSSLTTPIAESEAKVSIVLHCWFVYNLRNDWRGCFSLFMRLEQS